MTCGIYKITNKINGHSYIGQSVNIERRWKDEKHKAFNVNENQYYSTLGKAFRKYGIDCFDFQVIEECLQSQLNNREQYWIQFYDTYHNGYNETLGGDSPIHKLKLQENEVLEIMKLLANTDIPMQEIGQQYGISVGRVSEINTGKAYVQKDIQYPIRKRTAVQHYCIDCGKPITTSATRCVDCNNKYLRKVQRPAKEYLWEKIVQTSFSQVAAEYGVATMTIKRWCKSYNLPTNLKDLKKLYCQTFSNNLSQQISNSFSQSAHSTKQVEQWQNGILINIYSSTAEARQKTGIYHIKEVCDGKRNSAGGYNWKYHTD